MIEIFIAAAADHDRMGLLEQVQLKLCSVADTQEFGERSLPRQTQARVAQRSHDCMSEERRLGISLKIEAIVV